jgi:ABC-type sugar transport system substrate-binding protein
MGKGSKNVRPLIALAAVSLVMAACGGGTPAASGPPASKAPQALFGDTVQTLTPLGTSEKWFSWNKTSCKYEAATKPSGTWTLKLRKPTQPMTLGHQIQSEDNAINLLKNASVKGAADLAGFKYAGVNGKYPDQAAMVSAAENIVTQNPFAVIEDQPLATLADRLNGIYAAKCIPFLQLSLASPGAVTFGAQNADVGDAEAAALIDYVKTKNWKAEDLFIVQSYIPSLGPINDRVTRCSDGIKKAFPPAQTDQLQLSQGTVADTQTVMTNWLTSHPQAKVILGCTISGLQAGGMDNALKAANRNKDAAVMSTGNTAKDLAALAPDTVIIGSVEFGNENFGYFALAILEVAAEGQPVPEFTYTPLKFTKR